MPERAYHHGQLRATLLTAAERTLREHGVEQVSLRDLARQAGVSHGAPRRHFRDRQTLLDALAAAGFVRLAAEIAAAIENAGDDFEAQLRAVAASYVRFAVDDAALLDLMFARKASGTDAVPKTPELPYVIVEDLIQRGQQTGKLQPGDPERLFLIILATFQGIASLVASHKVPAEQIDALVTDATALFIRG
ncbi:MAG: TetR/AcrR family transcriptional regulator [Streptosporangiaceae bacterium]